MITGPFTCYDYTATPTTTTDAAGNTIATYPALAGVFYITDPATYAAASTQLSAYVVSQVPAQHVMGGDDPANPVLTVTLKFPDQATADPIVTSVNALPPVPSSQPSGQPNPLPPRTLSVYDFLMRFPTDKRIAIRAAQASDPVVADWMDLMNHVASINLDDPNTQAGVNYLVSKGYITSAEAAGVLA